MALHRVLGIWLGCWFASAANAQVTHVPMYRFLSSGGGQDLMGTSVAGCGDVNNDGVGDIAVGAPQEVNGKFGRVRVYCGRTGRVLYTFDGFQPGSDFGHSVAGAGDVNGDGFADLIVGARFEDGPHDYGGSARVFSGADGSVLYEYFGDLDDQKLGSSVDGAGDVNNDGTDDFVIEDRLGGGTFARIRVFSGADGSVIHEITGIYAGRVSRAGDVNKDGFDDILMGMPGWGATGQARVYSGADGTVLLTLNSPFEFGTFGYSVSDAGDVNSDGTPDVIVGASGGQASVHSGLDGSVLHSFTPFATRRPAAAVSGNDEQAVSGAGDVNGDGFDDVIVSAPSDSPAGISSGSALVYSGKDGSVIYELAGDSAGDFFGSSVSGVGDVNGDGLDDFVVGAYRDDVLGSGVFGSGSAQVFMSVRFPEPCPGDTNFDNKVDLEDLQRLLFGFGSSCP